MQLVHGVNNIEIYHVYIRNASILINTDYNYIN